MERDAATPREVRSAFEQLSDSGLPSLPTVTGTFIGTPADLHPFLDRLVTAVGRAEAQRLTVPCSYVQAAAEPERWGAGTWGARVAFAAKSHIVRTPMTPLAAADMAAAINQLHELTGVGGASGLLIDSLGGAVADRAPDATAFPHRTAVGVVQYHSYWNQLTPHDHVERRQKWLRDIHATMQTHLGTGGYTNGMDPELSDWPTAYHGANYPRMQRVKAACDPEQFFTFPQAVTPEPSKTRKAGGAGRAESGLDSLAARLRGRLHRQGDPGFAQDRLVRNRRYDHVRPQAIARIADEQDVAACLAFAARTGTPVAIRSGGHSYAGFCTGPGLMIDVGALQTVDVDQGRVRLGSGLSSAQVADTLSRVGLALPVARWGTVGVAGLTLGGGKSAFTRAWGLTCDRLTGATIVTPDGVVRRLTAAPDHPDAELMWALRGGGGGNFGVVTALEFAAPNIGGSSFARFLVRWSSDDTLAAVRGWQRWLVAPGTPRQVCSDMQLMLSGAAAAQPTVHGAWLGGQDALRSTLHRLVDAVGRQPIEVTVTPCDYKRAAMTPENPLEHTGLGGPGRAGDEHRFAWAGKSHIVRRPMDDSALAALAATVAGLHRLGATGGVYLDSLGGAVADLRSDATAFPHRQALAVLQYIVSWDGDDDSPHAIPRRQWLRASHAAMHTHLGTGAYVNDTDPDLHDWARAYYGDNYPRLQWVKATYDPSRLLDFPQAVTP